MEDSPRLLVHFMIEPHYQLVIISLFFFGILSYFIVAISFSRGSSAGQIEEVVEMDGAAAEEGEDG